MKEFKIEKSIIIPDPKEKKPKNYVFREDFSKMVMKK